MIIVIQVRGGGCSENQGNSRRGEWTYSRHILKAVTGFPDGVLECSWGVTRVKDNIEVFGLSNPRMELLPINEVGKTLWGAGSGDTNLEFSFLHIEFEKSIRHTGRDVE